MKKKTLTIAIALVLVVALAVGATYAYLTATTKVVTNTFTAGKTIEDPINNFLLKEHPAKYDETKGTYTVDTNAKPVESNTYDRLAPMMTAAKDPFISFNGKPIETPSYLFVEVVDKTNGAIKWNESDSWVKLNVKGPNGGVVYAYTTDKTNGAILQGTQNDIYILQGNKITAASDFDTLANTEGAHLTLEFYGYLCQATGFADAAAAFNQCFGTTTGK